MNRHLFRSRDDRMLAGVAGGLAELWDADPSLVRVIWAVLVPFTGGVALVVYIVMAIVVPEEDALAAPLAGQATGEPPLPGAGPAPGATPVDAREARRQARAARRATRGGRGSGVVIGVLLVLAGAYFLIREYVPDIDVNWLWPAALVVLGVVIVLAAFRKSPGDSAGSGSGDRP
jgi:phage shock protein C